MSDLVAHLHVKFCTINALLKHYVLIASRQCFNSVLVKCLGPFFFPYGTYQGSPCTALIILTFIHILIMKSLDPLRAQKAFIKKKLGHTAVSAIKASSVTL